MAKGPETKYIDKVHRQLDKTIWRIRMQMGMGAPRGIPDLLYRGSTCDLWVEYKHIIDWTKVRVFPDKLSPHQLDWFVRAEEMKGPNQHAIIIGDGNGQGVFLFYRDFAILRDNAKIQDISKLICTPKEIAQKIKEVVCL